MTRRLVFAGGIQAKALAKAYRLDASTDRDEDVFFIGLESIAREAAHRVIAAADIIVSEIAMTGEAVPEALVPARAMVVGVPVVRGDFLWPFAGRPHPRNHGVEALPEGPYPADFGDSHLDGLLAEGVPEDEAVQRYLEFDVASAIDLDGLLQRALEDQATLDVRTGFNIADIVSRGFRDGDLFATRERLHLSLFRQIAGSVFDRIGIDPARAESLFETHFPAGEMPIHPGVLRHFAMDRPAPDHAYPVLDEGSFTFEQYCRRYVSYTWNEPLHAAMALADVNPSEAIPALRQALEDSPGSQAGQRALELAERAVSDISLLPAPAGPANGAREPAGAGRAIVPETDDMDAEGLFADDGFGGFPPSPGLSWPTAADAASRLTEFGTPRARSAADHGSTDGTTEQQSYVELPLAYTDHEPPVAAAPKAPDRYTPLAPAEELIEVLPRMLPSARGLAGSAESPFATMPETMPPPPLRPVLPPEFRPEPLRRGLMAKLFGGGR